MTAPQPGWYADPAGDAELRWWDGGRWTDRVVAQGLQAVRALPAAPVQRRRTTTAGGLLSERVLVVDRRRARGPREIADAQGRVLGGVVPVGQTPLLSAARRLPGLDQVLPHRLELHDAAGVPQLVVVRPASVGRARLLVERPDGGRIGEVAVGEGRSGALTSAGRQVGSVVAASWRAWDFSLRDADAVEVARVQRPAQTPIAAGPAAPDTDVVTVLRTLQDPLLSLVVATALTLDTALRRD